MYVKIEWSFMKVSSMLYKQVREPLQGGNQQDQEGKKSKENQESQEKRDSYIFKIEAQEKGETGRFLFLRVIKKVSLEPWKCMRENNV